MKVPTKLIIISALTIVLFITINSQDLPQLQNLNTKCMTCLCKAATNCNLTFGCQKGYCGPYKISRVYWIDAGNLTLDNDDYERAGAYEDCAHSYPCAQRVVKNYLIKYGRDCNNDGVTNCEDYLMINFNGGYQCSPSLLRHEAGEAGREWWTRYNLCSP